MNKNSSNSLLGRLKTAMTFTRRNLVECIEDAFQGKKEIDSNLLEELESILIGADIVITTTTEILEVVKNQVDRKQIKNGDEIKVDVEKGIMQLLVDDQIIEKRLKNINLFFQKLMEAIRKCM